MVTCAFLCGLRKQDDAGNPAGLELGVRTLFFFVFCLLLLLFLHRELEHADLIQARRAIALLPAVGCLEPLNSLSAG